MSSQPALSPSVISEITLFCLVDGDDTPFPVEIESSKTIGLLKDAIKNKIPDTLKGTDAKNLTLWRVSVPDKGVSVYLDRVTEKQELTIASAKLHKVIGSEFPEETIHIIVQRPESGTSSNKRKWVSSEADGRIVRPKLTIGPYDSRQASMVFRKEDFKGFPLNDKRSFETVRTNLQFAYFDRTSYISVLESLLESVLLFLRPRRFGKSLFLSTLAHFHGVEHKQNHRALFQGLDVDQDIENKKVTPGQYLILSFDFSAVHRPPDVKTAEKSLGGMINNSIETFYQAYAPYLGEATGRQLTDELISPNDPVKSLGRCVNLVNGALSAVREESDPLYGVKGIYLLADEYDAFSNEYLSPDDPRPWDHLRTGANSLLKGFWAAVKSQLGPRSITKCFITGVSPLSMADHTSGFNVATYVSWREELSGLCGLTKDDVYAALNLLSERNFGLDITHQFDIMKTNYNGYIFAPSSEAQHVFNTNTCLEYLESLARGVPIDPSAVSNSEVSEPALQILAASPIASSIISNSLESQIMPPDAAQNRTIPYGDLSLSFRLSSLASDIATSKPAWLSYMLHIGGLTFCGDSKQLQIPNLIAAERFGSATLDCLKLRLEDVDLAFRNIVLSGCIRQAFALYKRTMENRDVGDSDFKKTEENHRDSFHYALLGNSHPSLRKIGLETHITKTSQLLGRIDMLIQVPLKKRVIVLEWKVVQIDFLDIISKVPGRKGKAEHLQSMVDVNEVLDLRFSRHDLWRSGQTIRNWIEEGPTGGTNRKSPRTQLAEYVASREITEMMEENEVTAYLVVVIGSRQVLLWEMKQGSLGRHPQLAA